MSLLITATLYTEGPSTLYDETSPDWVPSVKMGWETKTPDTSRYARAEKRKRRIDSESAQEVIREEVEQVVEEIQIEENECQSCTNLKHQVEKNADEISSLKEEIHLLKEQKSSLESEVIGLKKRLDASTLNAECLEKNKSKLKFYTGM